MAHVSGVGEARGTWCGLMHLVQWVGEAMSDASGRGMRKCWWQFELEHFCQLKVSWRP